MRRTAAILAPCEIRLDRVRYVKARAPGVRHDLDMSAPGPNGAPPLDVQELSAFAPRSADWPLVFFVGRLEGEDALARSYQRGDVPAEKLRDYPYMETAWIAFKTHWIERKEKTYSSVAHELAHLLCACGHREADRRHLLHPYRNFLGAFVLPEDCAAFRASSLVRERGQR